MYVEIIDSYKTKTKLSSHEMKLIIIIVNDCYGQYLMKLFYLTFIANNMNFLLKESIKLSLQPTVLGVIN